MIARNIPYKATLKALTTRSGRILPAMTPRTVPVAQKGMEVTMAP